MLETLATQKNIISLINRYSSVLSQQETGLLLSYVFDCDIAGLYINNKVIDAQTIALCDSLVERRLSGEPIQYITGTSEFIKLDFTVTKDVFIPRPETELLVREVLFSVPSPSLLPLEERVRMKGDDLRILDLCTGCGNIAVTLARAIPGAEIIALDISGPALNIARENALIHGVGKNIIFYKADIFQTLPFDKKNKFDIIVSNPPYIKSHELAFLQKEVRQEPKIALDGGIDGLRFYRRIADVASDYLKTKGSLFLEAGLGQAQDVRDIFSPTDAGYRTGHSPKGVFEVHKTEKDFAGIDRVIWINLL